jgi:hypothetical protein
MTALTARKPDSEGLDRNVKSLFPRSAVAIPTPDEARDVLPGNRRHRCFLRNLLYLTTHPDVDARLAHGIAENIYAHAWVVLPGGKVFDGDFQEFFVADDYYREVEEERRYTADQAVGLFARYGFVGPWHLTKGRLPHSLIARDIMAAVGGMLNLWFYRRVARLIPQADVYDAIFETRTEAASDLPALFTANIKARAEEKGIPL